jgi:Uma2 family endonuclease
MGAKTLISPEEYLAMHFPDRGPEYVRGELREKPMPDSIHGAIQAMLIVLLDQLRRQHGLSIRPENRCRVGPDAFRLPDVAVFAREPFELLPTIPAIVVAEIVSKEERRVELIDKLRDYAAWGVPNIWIVDPWSRRLAVWRNDAEIPVSALTLPEYGLEVRLDQLIEGLPL